jgi:hypothetical protein
MKRINARGAIDVPSLTQASCAFFDSREARPITFFVPFAKTVFAG